MREVKIILGAGVNLATKAQYSPEWISQQVSDIAEHLVKQCGDQSMDIAHLIAPEMQGLIHLTGGAMMRIDMSIDRARSFIATMDAPPEKVKKTRTRKPKVEKVEMQEPKEPSEIGVSSLDLSQGIIEKLLDLGLGTVEMVQEFDINTGLIQTFGESVSNDIYDAIELSMRAVQVVKEEA